VQQLKRFKDILAFSDEDKTYYAFQANSIQVAEISKEMWNSMLPYSLQDNTIPLATELHSPESVLKDLETWNAETQEKVEANTQSQSRKIHGLNININQICNLKCTYCYAGGDGTFGEPVKNISVEKTLPQIKFFMDRLQDGDIFSIKFVGGEPLLYTDGILAVAEYVNEMAQVKRLKPQYSIVTNGTQINDKNLKALISIKATVTVSCDGPPQIHDQFRKTKSGECSSKAVLEGIKRLVEHKSQLGGLQVSGVFGKHNMALVEAYKFYRTYPFDTFKFSVEFNEADPQFNQIFQEQFSEILSIAYESGGETELRRIHEVNHYFTQMDEQTKVIHHCGAGISNLAIDAKNRVYPCPMMVSNAQQEVSFNEKLIASLEQDFKENLIEQNNCNNCWARFICGGGCMYVNNNISGDLHKKSSTFCERTRFMITKTLSYYAKIRGEQKPHEGETHETH